MKREWKEILNPLTEGGTVTHWTELLDSPKK